MNKKINIKIITPQGPVLEDEIDQITLAASDGELTILPDHIPYIATLKPGEALVKKGKDNISLAVSGGFFEFNNNALTVLANTAERAEDIDLERAEEARKRAEELKKEKISADDVEFAKVAVLVEKELVRIKVAKKHRTKSRVLLDT